MPRRALHLLLAAGLAAAMMGAGASGAVAQDNGDDGDNGGGLELCPGAGIPADRISINMFTLAGEIGFGEPSVEDLEEIFAQLSDAGYRNVEPFGQPYSLPADEFRDLMADFGIRAASSHSDTAVSGGTFDAAQFGEVAAYAAELGQDYISAGFPPGGQTGTDTLESTLQMAEWLDEQGQIAIDAGIDGGVLVHNHNPEFENTHVDPTDDVEKSAWEILVSNTDPDLVGFQLDTYWAEYAGFDAIELLEEYGDRIKMLHVKDGTTESDDPSITQLGDGDLDLAGIFEAAWDHVDYYAYEYDVAPDAFDTAAEGFEILSCIQFDGRTVIDGPGNADEVCPDQGIPADQISIQLFTLFDAVSFQGGQNASVLENTFANLAAAGFRTVEPFGQPFSLPAGEFRDVMADFGIRAVSSHSNNALVDGELDTATYADVAAYANELGQDFISAGRPPGSFDTFDEALDMAETLNAQGQIAVDAGIEGGVLVHNHQQEFETQHEDPADGETKPVWQILVENTDPDLVGFQLDTYWAAYGGYDPIELIEEYGERIPMLHFKDGTTESDSPSITQLGDGDLDLSGIVEAAWEYVDYYAYEYDRAPDAFNTAAAAFEFMSCMDLDLPDEPTPPGEVPNICEELGAPQIFTDVDNTPHRNAIACLSGLGIVQGMGDGTYDPRGDVTRGQLASFVVRTMEFQSGETLPIEGDRFPDVGGPNSAHGDAISKLATAGIVRGYEDGFFRPADSVSRDQAARYVAGALEYLTGAPLPTSGAGFDDVNPGSQYAADIDRMVTAGILDGYPDGSFRPREPIKRDQMAKLIANALQVAVEAEAGAEVS